MINDVAGSNGAGFHGTLVTGAPKEQENKELEVLQNQAASLAEIMSGSKDSVEISDQARALSEAAKTSSDEAGASAHAVDTPEDDIAESSAAATEKTLDTRKGRDAVAADYNAVLEELRGQYGEAEAMRRFDTFMESEGFARVTENSNGVKASGGLNGLLRVFTGSFSSGMMPHIKRDGPLMSNLSSRSTLKGALVDGEVQYFAETYANYGANANKEVIDALSGLYRKNLESAQSKTSIDLAGYMENHFGSTSQISVVSASEDLGAVAANLLKAAGIDLGADGTVSFSLKEDGNGLYITSGVSDYDAAQSAIDAALRKNPDMLQAFKNEYSSVALTDTSDLDGAYADGARSIEYGKAKRSFTYSAQEPSVAVMTDSISVAVTGYTYQKKVSDSFDTDADFHVLLDGGVNMITWDFESNQKINRQMNEDIRRALETGEEIEATMTREEYEAAQAARSVGFIDPVAQADNAKLSSASQDAERENRAAEARQALLDLEADPHTRGMAISYRDERQEARKATVSQLLELFRPGRKTPGLDMINSIMESLLYMNATR